MRVGGRTASGYRTWSSPQGLLEGVNMVSKYDYGLSELYVSRYSSSGISHLYGVFPTLEEAKREALDHDIKQRNSNLWIINKVVVGQIHKESFGNRYIMVGRKLQRIKKR